MDKLRRRKSLSLVGALKIVPSNARPPSENLPSVILRSKLVFIGPEKSGKSSLLKSVRAYLKSSTLESHKSSLETATAPLSQRAPTLQTPKTGRLQSGVDVSTLSIPLKATETAAGISQIDFCVFDCSGASTFLPIQHLFWTDKAIYCILYDIEKPETLPFWLNCVRTHAPSASILLVATHADVKSSGREAAMESANRILKAHKSNFHYLRKTNPVSSVTGAGLVEFLRHLREIAVKQGDVSLGMSRESILFNSFVYRQRLALLELGMKPLLSWEEILAYALRCNVVSSRSPPVEEESKLFQALDYLNVTGVGLFLGASQTERSILLLDQSLLAEIFATLSSGAEKFAGDIPVDELHSNIWREFDAPLRDCIFEVLARNEIVLESPKGGSIILPPSLPKSRPDLRDSWPLLTDSPVTFSRVYKLPFLPSEIFSRLMVRLKSVTTPSIYWKDGFVVRGERKSVALLEQKPLTLAISVSVRGVNSSSIDLFILCIQTLQSLLEGCYGLKFQIQYIEPRTMCVFSQEQLDNAALKGKTVVEGTIIQAKSVVKASFSDLAPELSLDSMKALQLDVSKEVKILGQVGYGTLSDVFKASLTQSGDTVALKQMRKDPNEDEDPAARIYDFRREVMVMNDLKHPNIVKLLGYSLVEPLSLVMEFVEFGSLYDLFQHRTVKFDWKLRMRIALDVAQGLHFLHSMQYIHKDVKSPNILISSTNPLDAAVAKVADFNTTAKQLSEQSRGQLVTEREVENPTWLAPEILRKHPPSMLSDVYGFGVILWEIATLEHPYSEFKFAFNYELEEAILSGKRPTLPKDAPQAYLDLIQSCWADDPKVRPDFERICNEVIPQILQQEYPDLLQFVEKTQSPTTPRLDESRGLPRPLSFASTSDSPRSRGDSSPRRQHNLEASSESDTGPSTPRLNLESSKKLDSTPPGSPRTTSSDDTVTPRRARRATTVLDPEAFKEQVQHGEDRPQDPFKANLVGYNVWDSGPKRSPITTIIQADLLWSRIHSHHQSASNTVSFKPFLELLASMSEEKIIWQTLTTLSVLVGQSTTRDMLLADGLVDVLLGKLHYFVLEGTKLSAEQTDESEDKKTRRVHALRTLARQRAVILSIMNNCIAGLSEDEFPSSLNDPRNINAIAQIMRHQWDEKERLRSAKSSNDNASVFTELQAALALLGNMTFGSETVAAHIVQAKPKGDSVSDLDLLKDMLESSSCGPGAATVLSNIAAKTDALCTAVGSSSVIRRGMRALKKATQLDAILNMVSLLKTVTQSNSSLALYCKDEGAKQILRNLPFFAASDALVDELRAILKLNSSNHKADKKKH